MAHQPEACYVSCSMNVELALGSNVELRIDTAAIPVLHGALDAIRLGCIPGGLFANREFAECIVNTESSNISDDWRTLLFDPQTAGGLLVSVRAEHADALMSELQAAGYPNTCRIGEVLAGRPLISLV